MKKIFIFFTIAFLAIGIIACSSDDNTAEPAAEKELFLKADKRAINENETVVFTAFDAANKTVEADLYIDGVKVANNYQFTKKGIYVAVAKKAGYADTTPLTIEVVKIGEIIIRKLVFQADKYEVVMGERVVFSVTDGVDEINDISITSNSSEYSSGAMEWKPTKPGVYNFAAKKQGYFESDVISITVKQKEVKERMNFTIEGIHYSADLVGLAVKGDLGTGNPLLFTDKGKNFFIYTMYYYEENGKTSIAYSMKVYVPEDTNTLILPYEVDSSQIEPYEFLTYLSSTVYKVYAADKFTIGKMEWTKSIPEVSPGKIRTVIESFDKVCAIDYEGYFDELILDEFKGRNKSEGTLKLSTTKVDPKSVKIVKKKI